MTISSFAFANKSVSLTENFEYPSDCLVRVESYDNDGNYLYSTYYSCDD